MYIIRRLLGSLEARLNQPWFNLWRTIYFNFRTLPFLQAVKLPIFIYGKVHLFMLNGCVEFENTIVRRGMVKIGINADSFALFDHSGFVQLGSKEAKIIFEGPVSISVNCKIRVVVGELRFGKYAYIGEGVRVICNGSSIHIGEYSQIAFGTIILNSGFHHVYNGGKKGFERTTRPIIIGAYSWIGNHTNIYAGSSVKEHTIVCAGSLVNKDFTHYEGECQMLGGSPARIIGIGFSRIFSPQLEAAVINWFNNHPDYDIYHVEQFVDNASELNVEF